MLYGDLAEMVDVYRHCVEQGQFEYDRWGEVAFKDLFPLWMLKYLPNMAACHISIAHDARGHNNSIVEGGVSSLLAVWEAVSAIERGHADVMMAGGSGSFASFSCLPFRGWEHLSKWQGDPAGAARPFDAGRSGSVVGEGAAVLILEERSRAESRGAKILARVAGFASRFEAPGDPWKKRSGRAIRQSIEGALASAQMQPGDIGHVNAQGEGTIEQDRLEAQAIRDLLGDVPVTAPKSLFGDLAAGSGAVELVASVLALEHGRVPRTLNYDQPDPACPINVVHGQSWPVEKRTALVLNQAFTGQAAALVIAAN
jgi:3-oxoacyl-[acyl-carrier-protein] synthase II